jgi:hypothetical protein
LRKVDSAQFAAPHLILSATSDPTSTRDTYLGTILE